jgi:hypothetical protein
MRQTYLTLAAVTILFTATNCKTETEKVEEASTEVVEASKELGEATDDYQAEVAKYKIETADKITANEKSIADFNSRINTEKKEAREDYKKKIAELEAKNTDMKMKMDGYKADSKENWEKFKVEFARDMDELGQAFKDLTVKNVNQ